MAHSVSRSAIFAGLLASAILALATPAEAKKKKAAPAASSDEFAAPAEEGGAAGQPGDEKKAAPAAAQAGDVERPKPILDDGEGGGEAGPKADEKGNVTFIGSKTGKGKITVQAPPKEKVKVYLEGRYFGVAPRTINKIPPGDYIVEVVFPNGKSMSKPVSVSGEEEATVTVGAADALPAAPVEKPMTMEQAERRWSLAKKVGAVAVGAVVVGLGCGIWELMVQKDHDNILKSDIPTDPQAAANRESRIKSLEDKGNTLALTANILYVVGGVALVTAVFIGYPAYKAQHSEQKSVPNPESGTNMSFIVLPNPTMDGGSAAMMMRF